MKTPYDRLAKIYTNGTGHMTKMDTMLIYGKNPLNIFISGTKRKHEVPDVKLTCDLLSKATHLDCHIPI